MDIELNSNNVISIYDCVSSEFSDPRFIKEKVELYRVHERMGSGHAILTGAENNRG